MRRILETITTANNPLAELSIRPGIDPILQYARILQETFKFAPNVQALIDAAEIVANLDSQMSTDKVGIRYEKAEKLVQYNGYTTEQIKTNLRLNGFSLNSFLHRERRYLCEALSWDQKRFNAGLLHLPLVHDDARAFLISLSKALNSGKEFTSSNILDPEYPFTRVASAVKFVIGVFTGISPRARINNLSFSYDEKLGQKIIFSSRINYPIQHEFLVSTFLGEVITSEHQRTGCPIYDCLRFAGPVDLLDFSKSHKAVNDHDGLKYLNVHDQHGQQAKKIYLPGNCPPNLIATIVSASFPRDSGYRFVRLSSAADPNDHVGALVYAKSTQKIELILCDRYADIEKNKRLFSFQIAAFLSGERTTVPNFNGELHPSSKNPNHKGRIWIGGHYFDIVDLQAHDKVMPGIVCNREGNSYGLGFWILPPSYVPETGKPDYRAVNPPDDIFSYSKTSQSFSELPNPKKWRFVASPNEFIS